MGEFTTDEFSVDVVDYRRIDTRSKMGTRGKGADQMSSSGASMRSNEQKVFRPKMSQVFYSGVQNRTK